MSATTTPAVPEQPQLTAGLELLGRTTFGDLHVDLYGTVSFVGSRIRDFDLEDVTLAGTTISLETVIPMTVWERLEEEAYDLYTKSLAYVPTYGAAGVWRAA